MLAKLQSALLRRPSGLFAWVIVSAVMTMYVTSGYKGISRLLRHV